MTESTGAGSSIFAAGSLAKAEGGKEETEEKVEGVLRKAEQREEIILKERRRKF